MRSGIETPWINTTTSSSAPARPAAALAARLSENPRPQVLLRGGRARQPSLLPIPYQLRPADRQPGGQLVLRIRSRAQHRQPRDPRAARQGAGRLQRHQRPGLGARPAARLRHLGADGRARLELAGRGAALHAHRDLRGRRRQQRPRHAAVRCGSPTCPTRTRSTTRCSRPPSPPASSSIRTTTARTRKASSRPRPASRAAGA